MGFGVWRSSLAAVAGVHYRDRLHGVVRLGGGGEVVLFAQAAIDTAGDLSGGGADHLARAAAKKNGESDFGVRFVGVGDKPAYAGSRIIAGTGLAQRHFVAADVETALAGAVQHCGEHALANFGKDWRDVEVALDARREGLDLVRSTRILQIIKRATIREG